MIISSTLLAAAAGGLAFTAYLVICGVVAHRFTFARQQSPATQPEGFGALPVQFDARDGLARIDAWYLRAPGSRGAVIIVSDGKTGIGDARRCSAFALAQSVAAAGLSSLMIELRRDGEGNPARLSYRGRERHDVLGALDWLRAYGHRDDCIGVYGASTGAAAILLAAAETPELAVLVADGPVADFGLTGFAQVARSPSLPETMLAGMSKIFQLLTGLDLRRIRPADCAAAIAGRPLLVVQGDAERLTFTERAHAAGADDGQSAAADACLSLPAPESPAGYENRIAGFFRENLLSKGACAAANDGHRPAAEQRARAVKLARAAA